MGALRMLAGWSTDLDALIEAAWLRGDSASQISARVGRELGIFKSRSAIIGRLSRAGFKRHEPTRSAPATTIAAPVLVGPPTPERTVRPKPAPAPVFVFPQPTPTPIVVFPAPTPPPAVAPPPPPAPPAVTVEKALEKPPAIAPPGRLPLLQLHPWACRWPVGDGTGADQMFCGSRPAVGDVYCAGHRAVAGGGRRLPTKAEIKKMMQAARRW